MGLTPNTQLAGYEILASIGAGGMGKVYKARDTKLGREVAIKVLPEAFAQDKERLTRFEREARLLASLNHPNIATIHDLEESEGVHFLVLEFVPGETLAERIKHEPIPVDEALPFFKQIAEGLEAAHEKGVVHRDLKPANIKVTPEGKVKVLDFGLAKAMAGEAPSPSLSESPTLTRDVTKAGVLLGTAPYMSPEQARGKTVDKRTDIWAFGCCLYEALTGKAAFLGETVSDTIAAILGKEPDWEHLSPKAPAIIQRLLRRCLQKDPNQRMRDVGDARIEIEEALAGPSEAVASPEPKRLPLMTMVALTLAALSVAIWALTRSPPPAPKPILRTAIPLASDQPFALQLGGSLALSPDGRVIAYVTQRGGTTELYLRWLDQVEAKLIQGTEGASTPFFSPDSQWVGFLVGGQLMKVSVSGGAPVTVPATGIDRGASWSDRGTILFGGSTSGLFQVPATGGEWEILTRTDRERREKAHRFPEVLPGGKAIVFTVGTKDIESWDEASIAVLSLETAESRVILEGGMSARYSPSGHLVYARGGSLLAVPFDLAKLEVTGAPVPVLEDVAMSHISGGAEFSLSRDGWLLYAPGRMWGANRKVVWVDRQGRTEPLIDTPRAFADFELSPDDRFLAIDTFGANDSIWVSDLSRGTLSRLAFGSDNLWPFWTPAGDKVTFSSNRDGPWNLFWQAADGSSGAEPLAPRKGVVQYSGSWSPDGKTLVYQRSQDIWVLSVEGDREPRPLLEGEYTESHPQYSPNGNWIAYVSDESGQNEIYTQRFPELGLKRQVSVGSGTEPLWNPNGKELFYRNGGKMMVVDAEEGDGSLRLSTPRLLFERASPLELLAAIYYFALYDVTADGQRFVTIEEAQAEPPPTQLVLVQNWAEELRQLTAKEN